MLRPVPIPLQSVVSSTFRGTKGFAFLPSLRSFSNVTSSIFFAEVDGRKCLFVCELKSSFGVAQISHAKEQIVGTLLRLQAQLSILQSLPEWEYHGVIVSYEPTGSQLVVASKLTSRAASFSRYLCTKKHKLISSSIANKYYAPLADRDMTNSNVILIAWLRYIARFFAIWLWVLNQTDRLTLH